MCDRFWLAIVHQQMLIIFSHTSRMDFAVTEPHHPPTEAEPHSDAYRGPWWWRPGLMRHLTIILLLKLVAIVLIKVLFFSSPASVEPDWAVTDATAVDVVSPQQPAHSSTGAAHG